MPYQTMEMGPPLHSPAPAFQLANAQGETCELADVMGESGLLLAFVQNIWEPASIRRILYMQRHFKRFQAQGYNVALIIKDKQYSLWTFYMSSPMSVIVPLLADEDGGVHDAYNMTHAGLVLLKTDKTVKAKWLMPEKRVWPKARDLLAEASAT